MKKRLIGALTIALAGTMALGLAACNKDKNEVHDDILNGGFEQGFTGWSKSGTAFSQAGVVDADVAGEGKIEAGKKGKYFFSGYDAAPAQFTGSMQSEPFKLGGTGKIGFLMGGGMDREKCYVEFYEQGNDTALLKIGNEAFALGYITDQMVRVVADLSEHIGKTIYIKATDNDKGDADEFAYLNLDDFVVYKTAEEVAAAEKERADKLAAIGKPAFSETETDTDIKNGGFEEGLKNWLLLDGSAFGTDALNTEAIYWGSDSVDGMTTTNNRSYNKEGNNHLSSYFNEAATGSIRSTKFTLNENGTGIISFLMAGASDKTSYVAVCDGKTDEELYKVTFDVYSDPVFTRNMMRSYVDASEHKGDVLYIKVVDGKATGGFGGIDVDDFKVDLTEDEIASQMKADYERALTVEDPTVAAAEQAYYSNYDYPGDRELTVLRFENRIGGKAAKAGTVDLEAFLEEAKAIYDSSAQESDFTYAITGVKKGEEAVTIADFAHAALTAGLYTVSYSATYQGATIEESFLLDIAPAGAIRNGSFECGSLDGWTVEDNGASVSNGSVYWEGDANFLDQNGVTVQSYQKEGNYFLVTDEPQTVTIKSETFTVSGDYISFKFGIAKHDAYVALCDAATDAEIVKVTNDAFNDPTLAQIMLRRFIDVSELSGVEVYIKIVDGATGDFGFLNFDDLRVNMTEEEATALLTADKTWAASYRQDVIDSTADMGARAKDIINAIRAYYDGLSLEGAPAVAAGTILFTGKVEGYAELDAKDVTDFALGTWLNGKVDGVVIGSAETLTVTLNEVKEVGSDTDLKDNFTPAVGKQYAVKYTVSYNGNTGEGEEFTFTLNVLHDGQIHNGGFEYGDMTGWTTETEGFNTGAAVLGADKYWDEELPYNQSGNYHLDGFNTGIVETDSWSVKSETFVLGGAGIITVKMGGRAAAVKIYQVGDDGAETLIGYYKQTKFNDASFPDVTKGSWADMRTYVIDLGQAYIGKTLRIELCDETVDGGWANAFFDEVITYYDAETTVEELLQNKDKVTNGHGGEGNVQATEVELDWVSATNSHTAPAEDTAD